METLKRKRDDSIGEGAAPLVFAYYVTGHGLGHATRVVEVSRHLINAGHDVHIVTGVPEYVFRREVVSDRLHVRNVLLDSGAVQADALSVNRLASLETYVQTAVVNREALLDQEASWLRSIAANLVVSDVVPIACTAAHRAGIPSACVSNFSWDFVYSEYVTAAGHHHRSLVWQIAEDYSRATLLIRLPGFCPMPAFRDVVDVPLIVRKPRRTRQQVRQDLGIPDGVKVLLFNFGGQDASWKLRDEYLPPGWHCIVCALQDMGELASSRFTRPARDEHTPDLVQASDCVLGKIGYGTTSEALAFQVPFVFIRRDYFNEEPFLRKMLESHRCGVEMNRRDFFAGRWSAYLERASSMKPNYTGTLDGGEVAARLLEDAALGRLDLRNKASGSDRLRDAIVFGYQMQRAPTRDAIEIPDWYAGHLEEDQGEAQ